MKKDEKVISPNWKGKLKLLLIFKLTIFLSAGLIITPQNAKSSEPVVLVQQQRTISGTVTDSNGQPLPGVTVVVKGTTQGTVSNADGSFSISNVPENATLVFSFVGMSTQEVEVGNQTRIDIEMEEESIGLEEVVAIGYGTVRKSDLTGSVARVTEEVITERQGVSVMQSLQGSTAGLNVGQVNQAGQNPGISVRGTTSISGSQDPLIVVDGVIFRGNIIDINPNDIESIDILKDASSAAISIGHFRLPKQILLGLIQEIKAGT